jgi:hypothetical protein
MSARSDQSKFVFSVLAMCMLLAGGAIIASTDVGAQTVDRPSKYRAKGERMPSEYVKRGARTVVNPCGYGWHLGKNGQCYIN